MCNEEVCLRIPHETKAWGGYLDVTSCPLMSIAMDRSSSTHPSPTTERDKASVRIKKNILACSSCHVQHLSTSA